jgi:RecB family exonuclease
LEKNWDSRSYKQKQHEVEDKDRAKEMIKEFLAWMGTSPNKVKDVEKKFNMKIGDVTVVGKIDLVMETPQGEYQVFDFKTGKTTKTQKEAVEDTQMNLYPLAVKELYGKFPEKSTLYYIAKNLLVENKIEESNVFAVRDKLERAVESIIQENFEPEHEKGVCRFCAFRSICDHAEV